MDFRNNMQKMYVSEEEKEKFMEKLNRDVEVNQLLLLSSTIGQRHHRCDEGSSPVLCCSSW